MLRKSTRIHHHAAGDAVARASLIAVVCLCLLCFAQPTQAAIWTSGDVVPEDPSTWTSLTDGTIGQTENGTMNVTGGSDVLSRYAYIAYGSTGQVTVDGGGSTWTISSTSNWADIAGATYGVDYILSHLTEGDLAGYTMLTVCVVPEPSTLSMLLALGLALLWWRRRRAG